MSVNTGYLKEFVVFAGHMNFTAAAKTLNVSQPTLSRHISELEHHFGCELVDRASQVLRLTHCGKVLLEQAPELIASEVALDERMTAARREPYGSLVVEKYRKSPLVQGVSSRVLNELGLEHPGYSIVRRALRPGDTPLDAVLRGDIDLGVTDCTSDTDPVCPVDASLGLDAVAAPELSERISFVLPADSPLASRDGLGIADVADLCVIFPLNPEFSRCQPDVERLFAERGLRLRWRPSELDDVEELGLMKIGPNEAFIVVESAAASPDAFYLRNPELRVIACTDDVVVTRYLVFRRGDANPVLEALVGKLAR